MQTLFGMRSLSPILLAIKHTGFEFDKSYFRTSGARIPLDSLHQYLIARPSLLEVNL
jgi:hypothetical protein